MSKHVSVALCVRGNPDDIEVLLVCEGGGHGSLKSHEAWQIPGGKCCSTTKTYGCCKENPEKTVEREFLEETGLTCSVEAKLFTEIKTSSYGGRFRYHVFRVKVTGGTMLARKVMGSFESPMWFKLSELPPWMHENHRRIIRMLLAEHIDGIAAAA